METIEKIKFLYGPIQYGYIHINENHEIVLFTDEQGNVLDSYESWGPVGEV